MLAAVSSVDPWLGLLIGIGLLLLAPLVYTYQPKFHEFVRGFWGFEPSSSTYNNFQRTTAALFFLAIGSFAFIASLVRLI
jgi:hypothetical protein